MFSLTTQSESLVIFKTDLYLITSIMKAFFEYVQARYSRGDLYLSSIPSPHSSPVQFLLLSLLSLSSFPTSSFLLFWLMKGIKLGTSYHETHSITHGTSYHKAYTCPHSQADFRAYPCTYSQTHPASFCCPLPKSYLRGMFLLYLGIEPYIYIHKWIHSND